MKYLREYMKALTRCLKNFGLFFLLIEVMEGSPVAFYFVYVCLIVAMAGIIALMLEKK